MTIHWEDFKRVELRVGTVVAAEPHGQAPQPAYILQADLGDFGIRTSSAQITDHYATEELLGRQVLCVCNFEPKWIAGVKSEVLVTGAYDGDGKVVLAGFDLSVPDGTVCSDLADIPESSTVRDSQPSARWYTLDLVLVGLGSSVRE